MGLGLSGGSRGLSKLKKLVVGIVSSIKTTMTGNETSTTALLAAKAIYDWAVGKFIDSAKKVISWAATPSNDNIPSEKLVKDSLDLKADITPATGATSALRALYIARGATYNGDGTYTYAGFTDITESEIMTMYIYSMVSYLNARDAYSGTTLNCRTFFQPKISPNSGMDMTVVCAFNTIILGYNQSEKQLVFNCVSAFIGASNIHTIQTLNFNSLSNVNNTVNAFYDCSKLVNLSAKNVKVSFSFAWSPLLSLASLQYLVNNRANETTRITITVHATVWSKLNDSVNYQEWNALLVDAVANQYIDFASA